MSYKQLPTNDAEVKIPTLHIVFTYWKFHSSRKHCEKLQVENLCWCHEIHSSAAEDLSPKKWAAAVLVVHLTLSWELPLASPMGCVRGLKQPHDPLIDIQGHSVANATRQPLLTFSSYYYYVAYLAASQSDSWCTHYSSVCNTVQLHTADMWQLK